MDCQDCLKRNKELFEKKPHLFEDHHHLTLFLINIVLNIQNFWSVFCCCKRSEICLVCQAKVCYQNYEDKIYDKCLDLNFLAETRENIYRNLLRLLTLDNHFVCRIINQKYCYIHKNWFTGEKFKYDLDYCFTTLEQKKLEKIKNNNCKVVLRPISR